MQVHTLYFSPQRQPMHHVHTHINREDSPPLILTPRTKGQMPYQGAHDNPTTETIYAPTHPAAPTTCADIPHPDNIRISHY